MSQPQFPDPMGRRELLSPGATAHKAGLSLEDRVKALEQGALGRPGPGVSNGSVITSDTSQTGGVKWQPPICGLYHLTTGGLTIAVAGWTSLTTLFNTQEYEKTSAGSSHYNTTTGRFTAPVAGVYRITVSLAIIAATSTETYGIGVFKNGAIFKNNHIQAVSNGYLYDTRSWDIYLAANDYLNAAWFQNAATSRTWSESRRDCSFSWHLVHAF